MIVLTTFLRKKNIIITITIIVNLNSCINYFHSSLKTVLSKPIVMMLFLSNSLNLTISIPPFVKLVARNSLNGVFNKCNIYINKTYHTISYQLILINYQIDGLSYLNRPIIPTTQYNLIISRFRQSTISEIMATNHFAELQIVQLV